MNNILCRQTSCDSLVSPTAEGNSRQSYCPFAPNGGFETATLGCQNEKELRATLETYGKVISTQLYHYTQ